MTAGNKVTSGLVITSRDKKFVFFILYLILIPIAVLGVYVLGMEGCSRYYWINNETPRTRPVSQWAVRCAKSSIIIEDYSAHFARKLGLIPPLMPAADNTSIPQAFTQTTRTDQTQASPETIDKTPQESTLDNVTDTKVFKGQCNADSHIAEGNIGDDLTQHQSRFFCDIAVMSRFKDNPNHILIQFSDSQSHHAPQLGFSGIFDDDGHNMNLQRVYLETGKPINVKPGEDGICKILSKDDHFIGLFCAAKIDEDGRRTVPLVGFDLSPNQ